MAENGTLQAIGQQFLAIVEPVGNRIESGQILQLLAELGIQFPDSLATDAPFIAALEDLIGGIETISTKIVNIADAITAEDYGSVASKGIEMTQAIVAMINGIDTVKDTIENLDFSAEGISNADLTTFVADFASNLLDLLIVSYIEQYSPTAVSILDFIGVIERTEQNIGSVNPLFPEYTKKKLHLNNLLEFVSNPIGLFGTLYDWGSVDFDGVLLFEKIHAIANQAGLPIVYNATPTPSLDFFIFSITPEVAPPAGQLPGLAFLIKQQFTPGAGYSVGDDDWSLAFDIGGQIDANAGLAVYPSGKLNFVSGLAVDAEASVTFSYGGGAEPTVLFGEAGASRFEIQEISALIGGRFSADTNLPGKSVIAKLEAEIKEGAIIIKPQNPDGFLGKILPPDGIIIDMSLLIGFDTDRGFYFDGSGGLEIQLPTNLQLGPILIESLILSLRVSDEGIPLTIGSNIGVQLGPFAAVVKEIGMKADISFPPDKSGNLSFANIELGFKPPSGVGLSVDAGVVKGGGFLDFDFDEGKYTGIIQLSVQEVINIIAIGIITTQNPDGTKGFSLLLLITAEFTPIQLGFGFTLNGVGGLIGVNRTMVLQALRDGVKDNTLDNILFPSDPIANAIQIINDLETVFPIEQDRFTFGLMGKLGWGTPTLISLELGLMLEVPNPVRLAILGVIKMTLPTEEAAILKLQVNFVGTIDFEAKYITFDASLFDSTLLIFTLEGDMALRIKWGEESNFLFTVGGFHPDYTPPPLDLPSLNRLSISLLSGNPRLTISTYFAVTSNTVQFGAGVDFYFGVSEFKVLGYLNFDALFQFNPFYFRISLSAGLGVYLGSAEILSIHLSGSLEGPTPWHITGRVKFKILFIINVSKSIETTWGDTQNTSLPDIAVLPLLKEALSNKANWITPLESDNSNPDNLVQLRTIANDDEAIIAHPQNSLSVSQKIVPLDINIEKFGTQNPSDFTHFHLDMVDIDGNDITDTPVSEEFAPDSFFNLSETQRLSRPSFEKYNSGLDGTGSTRLESDYFREREVMYETIIVDDPDNPIPLQTIDLLEFNAFIKNGSIAKSSLGAKMSNATILQPDPIEILSDTYQIVSTADLSAVSDISAGTQQEAQAAMQDLLIAQPELEGQIDIVPSFELA